MDIRTVKIPISFNLEQSIVIKHTMLECQEVFNYFANLGCTKKSTSYTTLHKYGYQEMKNKFPDLPTAYIQSAAKQALSAVKSFNANIKKNKNKDKQQHKWEYPGSKKSMQLPLNKLTLSRRGKLTGFSTTNKRVRTIVDIPDWFIDRYNIQDDSKIQAGVLKYFESTNQFVLYLIYAVPSLNINNESSAIIGVDRGLYNICTLSTGEKFSSKKIISVKRKRQYQRKMLQRKGTRSAKRRLKKLSGREKRFTLDTNHCISKKLSINLNVSVYVLEDLKNIRDTRKGKKVNSWLSNWSFFQLQSLLEYKCKRNNILVTYVDPHYTSQKCAICGTIDKTNRHKSKYVCKNCGNIEHADVNAAINIKNNYVQSMKLEQAAVNQPIVSDVNV